MATALLEGIDRDTVWTGSIIDVDVHANVPSVDALMPYMSELWVAWIEERGWTGPRAVAQHYPANSDRASRAEWRPVGAMPASNVSLLQTDILDPWRLDHAIVNCYYGVESVRHPDWAAALASAVNDWLIGQWLEKDSRLRATMVLPARDPEAMIEEIRRVGDHPGFVQALFPVRSDTPWGQRIFHSVYRELVQRDLVMGLHYGGTTDGPPSTTGNASWLIEEYAAEWQSFATQVTSLVTEGVFVSHPELRVSVLEGGFIWAPVWGWRMDKEWKGLRKEVPWLTRAPLSIIRDHIKFSVAPTDGGTQLQLERALKWMGSDDMLMFATDYPHRHDDDISALIASMSHEAATKLMSETARSWYRL